MKSIKANAKVNLHLQVLNKRPDGFHNIFSLMAGVDLYDLITIESLDIDSDSNEGKEIRVSVESRGGEQKGLIEQIPDEDNLIVRAAESYLEKAGFTGSVSFGVEKNIPAGGGLGGGSSDAAAVLSLLNGMIGGLSDDDLHEIAVRLGADVSFCLIGGFALCSGIGDRVQGLPNVPDLWVLIANDSIHVDTAAAYESLGRDENYSVPEAELNRMAQEIKSFSETGEPAKIKSLFFNDFEEPVFSSNPGIRELKKKVKNTGADFVVMSGSGSSIVGVFEEKDKAEVAFSALKKVCSNVYLTKFA